MIKAKSLRAFNINYPQNSTLMATVTIKDILTHATCRYDIYIIANFAYF